MKKKLYLKLFSISIIGALLLSTVSLYCLVSISDMVVEDYRYGYLMYIARAIEKSAEYRHVENIDVDKYPAPLPPKKDTLSLVKITEFGGATLEGPEAQEDQPAQKKPKKKRNVQRGPRPSLWLVSDDGTVISSTTNQLLPLSWKELPVPRKIHGIRSVENVLFKPKIFTVKLDTVPQTYLVSHNERSLFQGPFLWIQGTHTFTTVALAVFLALSLTFYYLRRKSMEARKVLSQLESGDLKARFKVEKVDEFGNLILDFNRMADQIEKLVKRIHDAEATRSNLLQELGHDLRTPLTSLSTSFEALQHYHNVMEDLDREELFSIIDADIRYFKELLDKLTIIASIDAPGYKAKTEQIDLTSLLEDELKNRQSVSGDELRWDYEVNFKGGNIIAGDYHLITRLFKNAFDNAARYANKMVKVRLVCFKDNIEVFIADDGPGLTPEQLQSFGKRRERRELKHRNSHDFSLGLGSVIMKTIAEVHDGSVHMSNWEGGACLKVSFKRS